MPSRIGRGRSVFALVFLAVLLVRGAYLVSLSKTPLSLWHLWTQTDEWGYMDWSAHLAAGNWRDVPAWRSYFGWQEAYGSPEDWEEWYQKNAYFSGPLYPYGLAALRLAFGSPVWPARILQLLLACVTSGVLALAVLGLGEGLAVAAAAVFAGILYGLYGPLVFHDGFILRDGPVAHFSTLLLALPLIARVGSEEIEEKKEISSNGDGGRWMCGTSGAFLLGFLGGLAILLKQTVAPLALASLFSLYSPSGKPPGGAKRRVFLFGFLGLAIPLFVLAARNVSAGVPPLTFDTRQTVGLVWGNARGADASTTSPPGMDEMLEEARGSTLRTARLVLESYRGAPLELPKLFLKKLATFFNVFEVPDNANFYFFRDRLWILRVLPVFPCLLGAGGIGLGVALTRRLLVRGEGLLVFVGVLTPLAACLLVQTTSRYRAAMAGPLALGCGLFLLFTFEAARHRRLREAGLLALAAGALSVVPLLPSVIPAGRHRFSDALVFATLVEAKVSPEAGAAEIERYLAEGADDRDRDAGVVSVRYWLTSGDRSNTGLLPEGVAPAERRFKPTLGR